MANSCEDLGSAAPGLDPDDGAFGDQLLGQLGAIRRLDQLPLFIEIAQKIEFADSRHILPPITDAERALFQT